MGAVPVILGRIAPMVYWWLGTSALQSVAQTADASAEATANLQKAAPWIVGGIALFVLMKKGR